MTDPKTLYTDNSQRYATEQRHVKQRLLQSSLLRLLVFIGIIVSDYLLWANTKLVVALSLGGIVLFFYLVSRHANLQAKRRKLQALEHINTTELQILNGDFDQQPDGEAYKNPTHPFSQDIDLFGKHSFFQYLNRTALKSGTDRLAQLLTSNNLSAIEAKQKAIAELAELHQFRQDFTATALLTSQEEADEPQSTAQSLKNLHAHQLFTPRFSGWLSKGFSLLSLVIIASYFLDFIPASLAVLWLLIGLIITGVYLKRVNDLSGKVSKIQIVFRQYHQLLALVENVDFKAPFLQDLQQKVTTDTQKASAVIQQFSKTIDALDQRGNLLFGFLGNGFLLWDLQQSYKLEKWLKTHRNSIGQWFEVLAELDAYNSLGNFAFNHPDYTYPQITTDDSVVVAAQAAVHPLIPKTEAVTNDFKILKDEFLIITGANMAGKSTFLRTVALQIVMSNIGLPVRAAAAQYHPIKLITSMRTVDSLAEEASYFYAELSRLKYIIDHLKSERYFIILDEILKGTNSTDKAIGSRKFLEKLVASHSTGIIATHDLSLCEVADHLPQVRNHYFDAQIIDDDLFFDYKFKDGICQNMNASFLLKKMEIIDD